MMNKTPSYTLTLETEQFKREKARLALQTTLDELHQAYNKACAAALACENGSQNENLAQQLADAIAIVYRHFSALEGGDA